MRDSAINWQLHAKLFRKNTYLGRAYMNWARHPITEKEPLELGERGYIVRISYLRFERAGREHYSPSVRVRLNRDLSIADMSFGEQETP